MNRKEVNPAIILVVEDNPGDVQLIREAFKSYKIFNILETVSDGEKAIKFLKKAGPYKSSPRPDLILLDLNLPGKDGREVLSEIKSDPGLKSIPIIILTSSSAQDDVLNAYDLHANCYIKKPVDFDGLVDVVKSIENFWFSIVRLPNGDY
jgi:CheY-like chemotaxis protein